MKRIDIEKFDKIIIKDGEIMEFFIDDKRFDGVVFEKFNGHIASEFQVKNGVKNGLEIVYYPNQSIESKSNYKNGILHGLNKIYYESGKLEEVSFFEYGICLWHKLYDEKGSITSEFHINKNSPEYEILKFYRKNEY